MTKPSLQVVDQRTNITYEIAIQDDTVRAMDLRQIKQNAQDFGLMTYDPGYLNTASCRSAITFIDGDKGLLWYRGYPIEELASKLDYVAVAYLLLNGSLGSPSQLSEFDKDLRAQLVVPSSIATLISSFPKGSHPMGIFISAMAALSCLYPEAKNVQDKALQRKHALSIIAKALTIGAWSYAQSQGLPFVQPDQDLPLVATFLKMLKAHPSQSYQANEYFEKALNILFILHADHEQNCSTSIMRSTGSSLADPYVCISAAAAALYGPLHGGANEAVLKMLQEIGHIDHIPAFIKEIKEGKGGQRLMGFGHRVYKSYDPRAALVKQLADQVFAVTGKNPLLDIALELERIALQDEYFISRKLYPNVDFYTGLIYQAMGLSTEMFLCLFAIPRTVGWVTQWMEMLSDSEQKISRPRQIYTGSPLRHL